MIPRATRTHLNHVTGEGSFPARNPGEFSLGNNTAAMGGQPGPEDVPHVAKEVLLADRTVLVGADRRLGCRAAQLGVSVADHVGGQSAIAVLLNHGLARQPIVDASFIQDAGRRYGCESHAKESS